jgi:hypothetical protein
MENLDQTYKRLLEENKPKTENTVDEAIKGKQKKLDKNHNGKLDAQDFKILRKEDTDPPFDKPYTKSKGTVTDKSGAKHTGMSRARDLARSSLNKTLNKTYDAYNPEKDKLKKQHFGMSEEVKQIEEAKPGLYANINAKRKRIEAGSKEHMRKPGSKGAPSAKDFKDAAKTANEEVQIDEVNHREFAQQGKMHPDMTKHMATGHEFDFYHPKTGDKTSGIVKHKSDSELHIKTHKDGILGAGYVHKFKVTDKLEEGMYSSDVERAFPNGKASGVKTHAPVAPVPPKKKEQMKPRVGHPTNMKEEVEQLDEKIYADDYHSTSETSQFGGHRPHVIAKDTGKTMYLGQHAYKTPKHAIEHAQAYLSAYSKTGMHGADRASTAYATANKHNHHINEAKDEKEYGYEGDMAMNQLKTLVRCAEMIEDCLKPDTDLPEWVQSKITLATDYIQTAADYLYSEMDESTTETNKYTITEDNIDEAWMLRQKKKEKKPVKEENMKSFRDFLQDINEVKMADLPVRKIQGRSYGNQPEEDDEEDKPTQSAEKRGRGRPAGAKSGAKQIGSASKQKSGVEYTGYKLHLPNSNK